MPKLAYPQSMGERDDGLGSQAQRENATRLAELAVRKQVPFSEHGFGFDSLHDHS